MSRLCSTPGCDCKHRARGLCSACYNAVAAGREPRGRMTAAERVAEWEWLVGGGVDPDEAARRVGVTMKAIEQARARRARVMREGA